MLCDGSWPNFRKSTQKFYTITKKNDGIDIPVNTQKPLVSGNNTQKLLINFVSVQCNIVMSLQL